MWDCHVDDSAKGRYDMIVDRDISTTVVLNLKLCEHIINIDDGALKGLTSPMIDLGNYTFKGLNTGKIKPEESFMKA